MNPFSPDKMSVINANFLEQAKNYLKQEKDFAEFMKEINRMKEFCIRRLTPEIPKLEFADSALWMWLPQLNLRRSLLENNRVWKDEFFRTDPTTDYNN